MSVDDIVRVNGKIVGLCMAPGQYIEVACPHPHAGRIRIHAGMPVKFEYIFGAGTEEWWLSLSKERPPKWSRRFGDSSADEYGIDFKKGSCAVIELLKAYKRHFPFVSTNNYFLNNGECIA